MEFPDAAVVSMIFAARRPARKRPLAGARREFGFTRKHGKKMAGSSLHAVTIASGR
ncbi:hypothetical protein [Paraburkholderia sp. 31.1]|uniref:hypothetical protein n=1 Tax=Paraburkholderia sp. 31.1 TaxID=2615205 RepID=UPI0016561EC2|nr:hypothetical protein [Paraburkholderia sp. 31.1]